MKISDYVESQIKGLWGTDFDENGISVIKTNNLTYEGHIDYSDICKRNITEEQAKGWYLKPGDLLIEKSGGTKTHSVGYVSYFEGEEDKFVCNNFILALRPKNTINSKFLFYQIQFKYESNQFSDCFNKTTGIQNLKVKDYLAKEIKIYSPEKQEKIVKELDTVRSIINKNKQILKKYDTLIKSRFIEMFGENPVESGKWKVEKFKNICLLITDGEHTTPQRCTQGIYLLSARNVLNHKLQLDNVDYIDESEYQRIAKRIVPQENDILLSCSGSVGRVCVVPKGLKFQLVRSVALLRLKKDVNPIFMEHLITSDHIQTQIEKSKTQSSQANLFQGKIAELIGFLPPLYLQNDFAAFVQQVDKSKFVVQKSLEKAETLYKSLMQEYFN